MSVYQSALKVMYKALRHYAVILFLTSTLSATAQNTLTRTLQGSVIEQFTKTPLAGASVVVEGTTSGTQTDKLGRFSLQISSSKGVELKVSLIGYKSRQLSIGVQTTVEVALEPSSQQLNEVVSIGYATVKKRDVNGAISSVTAGQIKDVPLTSLGEALAGRLAGVQITQSEGSPDASLKVLVRGGGSITQSNDPLYVIDGVQVENGLASLSPADIQTVDVLKDAASTAIYGARGANGVVIITTKGGKVQPTRVNYNYFFGFKRLARELKVLSPSEFLLYQYERSRSNSADSLKFAKDYGSFDSLTFYKNSRPIDWQKKALGNLGLREQHNISITGGNVSSQFNVSFTYDKEKETVLNSSFDRKVLNFRFDHTATSQFKFGFNTRYSDQNVFGAGTSSSAGSTYNNLRNSVKYRPFVLPGISEDDFDQTLLDESNAAGNNVGVINPVILSNAQYRKNAVAVLNLNGNVTYTFNKHLSLRSTFGIDQTRRNESSFDAPVTFNSRINGNGAPLVGINNVSSRTVNWSNVFTLSSLKNGNSNVNFTALLGQELYNVHSDNNATQYKFFPTGIAAADALNQLSQGTLSPTYPQLAGADSRLVSFFTRASLGFGKYLASATLRADGSSKFAPGRRWGLFPSAAVSWRISDERFLQQFHALTDIKLRLSYGTSGNNRISDYLTESVFNSSALYPLNKNLNSLAYASPYLANPNLRWETTVSQNLGLDFSALSGRVQVSLDAYRGTTSNLLLQVPIAVNSGYTTQLQNVGKTQNKGFEVQLGGRLFTSSTFSWSVNLNGSFNQNKVLALAPGQNSYFANSGWGVSGSPPDFIVQVGKSVGSAYGYVSDGFYKAKDFDFDPSTSLYTLKAGVVDPSKVIGTAQPGLVKFKDLDGDGVTTTADQTILGNTVPKITGGLNQQFVFHRFDASVFVNFQAAARVLNANKVEFSNGYTLNTNLLATSTGRWRTVDQEGNVLQKVGQTSNPVVTGVAPDLLDAYNSRATLPIPTTGAAAFYLTSDAVENAAFVRLNNVSIGYTFAGALLGRLKINRLRIYATGNNLAILTAYSGYDPDVNARRGSPVTPGVDYSAYPRTRSYVFGVNLTL